MSTRSRAASRRDRPLTPAQRSITSPLAAHRASKHWKTLSPRWTLKVRPRPSPRWIGHGPRRVWDDFRSVEVNLVHQRTGRRHGSSSSATPQGTGISSWPLFAGTPGPAGLPQKFPRVPASFPTCSQTHAFLRCFSHALARPMVPGKINLRAWRLRGNGDQKGRVEAFRHAGGHRFKSCSAHSLTPADRNCRRVLSFVRTSTCGERFASLLLTLVPSRDDRDCPRLS